jgi:hypothetical protein
VKKSIMTLRKSSRKIRYAEARPFKGMREGVHLGQHYQVESLSMMPDDLAELERPEGKVLVPRGGMIIGETSRARAEVAARAEAVRKGENRKIDEVCG